MDDPTGYLETDFSPLPEKPAFLKILCILSFVWCGLMIILFALGIMCLFLSEDMINTMWDNILKSQPQLGSIDRFEFFHQVGITCIYNLIGNIISLTGVILMWRLNKIGFFIYAIAELAINFFGMDLKTNEEASSHAGLIFVMLIDFIFVMMYAANLKYMKGAKPQEAKIS